MGITNACRHLPGSSSFTPPPPFFSTTPLRYSQHTLFVRSTLTTTTTPSSPPPPPLPPPTNPLNKAQKTASKRGSALQIAILPILDDFVRIPVVVVFSLHLLLLLLQLLGIRWIHAWIVVRSWRVRIGDVVVGVAGM